MHTTCLSAWVYYSKCMKIVASSFQWHDYSFTIRKCCKNDCQLSKILKYTVQQRCKIVNYKRGLAQTLDHGLNWRKNLRPHIHLVLSCGPDLEGDAHCSQVKVYAVQSISLAIVRGIQRQTPQTCRATASLRSRVPPTEEHTTAVWKHKIMSGKWASTNLKIQDFENACEKRVMSYVDDWLSFQSHSVCTFGYMTCLC